MPVRAGSGCAGQRRQPPASPPGTFPVTSTEPDVTGAGGQAAIVQPKDSGGISSSRTDFSFDSRLKLRSNQALYKRFV